MDKLNQRRFAVPGLIVVLVMILTGTLFWLVQPIFAGTSGKDNTSLTESTEMVAARTATPIEASETLVDPTATPTTCPVTIANGNNPPGQPDCTGCHGNGELWVGLWPNGNVIFEPDRAGFVLDDGSLAMKFWMWRNGKGELTIKGRRLDSVAPPLGYSAPDGYPLGFQPTSLIFPTTGCWEVTMMFRDESLTFVTRVLNNRNSILPPLPLNKERSS